MSLGLWVSGSLGLWGSGSLGLWVSGSLGLRVSGSLCLWVSVSTRAVLTIVCVQLLMRHPTYVAHSGFQDGSIAIGSNCEQTVRAAPEMEIDSSTAPPVVVQRPSSVTFRDSDNDSSTLKLNHATRQLSWHAKGRCYLQDINVLEWTSSNAIRAPEHSALTARLVDPPPGPDRDKLLQDIATMAKLAGVEHLSGFPDVDLNGPINIPRNTTLKFIAQKSVQHRVETEQQQSVVFYELMDGRGWIHDFDQVVHAHLALHPSRTTLTARRCLHNLLRTLFPCR